MVVSDAKYPFAVRLDLLVHRIRRQVKLSWPGYNPIDDGDLPELSLVMKMRKHTTIELWRELDRPLDAINKAHPQRMIGHNFDFGNIPIHCFTPKAKSVSVVPS